MAKEKDGFFMFMNSKIEILAKEKISQLGYSIMCNLYNEITRWENSDKAKTHLSIYNLIKLTKSNHKRIRLELVILKELGLLNYETDGIGYKVYPIQIVQGTKCTPNGVQNVPHDRVQNVRVQSEHLYPIDTEQSQQNQALPETERNSLKKEEKNTSKEISKPSKHNPNFSPLPDQVKKIKRLNQGTYYEYNEEMKSGFKDSLIGLQINQNGFEFIYNTFLLMRDRFDNGTFKNQDHSQKTYFRALKERWADRTDNSAKIELKKQAFEANLERFQNVEIENNTEKSSNVFSFEEKIDNFIEKMKPSVKQVELKWNEIIVGLEKTMNPRTFGMWMKSLKLIGFKNNKIVLLTPNRFSAKWLRENYQDKFNEKVLIIPASRE